MKKKFLTLCAIVSISAMSIACGDTASEAETPDTEVTSEVADADTQTDAAEAEVSEEVEEAEDASSAEGSDEEGKYVVFTDASNAEVEAYAQKVIDAAIAKDWDTIGDMLQYPIGSKEENNLCKNKEEFVAYAKNTGFEDEFFTALSSWKMSDLWGNWRGACIADGDIWFRDMNPDKTEFKVVKFFDLAEPEGEITD